MSITKPMSSLGRVYIWTVIAAGGIALAHAVNSLHSANGHYGWVILAALTLLSGSFPIKVPSIPATISVSETFVFAAIFLFGTPAASLIVAVDALAMSLRRRNSDLAKILFNVAQPSLSIWLASDILHRFSSGSPVFGPDSATSHVLWPILLLSTTYFIFNSSLTAIAIGLATHYSALYIWRTHFLWLSLNYFVGASLAALLVRTSPQIDISMIGVIIPLLVVSYLTFKFSMSRVEDADRHVDEVSKLYLSTVETLAMAVDAKDQTTHGHIRRVQVFAVALAEEMGISDSLGIKAIQAAALLHDVGKLAVPDYILNKPGSLTASERQRMELHATAGADILSAIPFPYPVVPIVRHHHERWDGTGYPSGLSGTAIPLGARILAVVDCFDALTSDRPYRPKLSVDESFELLTESSGTMYDPMVVNKFISLYPRLATLVAEVNTTSTRRTLSVGAGVSHVTSADRMLPLETIASSTEEMIGLYGLAKSLAGQVGLADTSDMVAKHLKRLVPASLCVFYVPTETGTELVARHAIGESAGMITGLRIQVGERLSGWVAANRQAIVNSDPALDFGDTGRRMVPRLRSSISIPLIHGQDLIGVLSLYGERVEQFSNDHKRILDVIGGQVSYAVRAAIGFDRNSIDRNPSTGLPTYAQLERMQAYEISGEHGHPPIAVLMTVQSLSSTETERASLVKLAADTVKQGLRAADMLFQRSDTEFVLVLPDTDRQTAFRVGDRIKSNLLMAVAARADLRCLPNVLMSVACAPEDGNSLVELVAAAERGLIASMAGPPGTIREQESIH